MLIYPQSSNSEVGTIVGIDPGTNLLGFSILRFDLRNLEVISVEADTFKSERMIEEDDLITITHNERIAKLYAQKNNLLQLFNSVQPNWIACEHPFMNRFRPNAFGPLMECLFAIRTAAIEYSQIVKFFTYPPSIIKKAVGAGAHTGKDPVKEAVLANKELSPNEFTHLGHLDNNAIDAIAIAYTHLKEIRREK